MQPEHGDSMRIWKNVCATDPAHTKRVSQRGGFTAIDAYSQIMCATKEFGPAGEGWGWYDATMTVIDGALCVIQIKVWHGERTNYIDTFGCASTRTAGQNAKPDADCVKKALTDGITKGLSYLGFNADVFMGKFDDNAYVEEAKRLAREKAGDRPPPQRQQQAPQASQQRDEGDGPPDDAELRQRIYDMLMAVFAGDQAKCLDKLEELSGFNGDNGPVKGKRSTHDLSGKWLNTTYGKVKKYHEEWQQGQGGQSFANALNDKFDRDVDTDLRAAVSAELEANNDPMATEIATMDSEALHALAKQIGVG